VSIRIQVAPGVDGLVGRSLEEYLAETLGPRIQEKARNTVATRSGNLKASIIVQVRLDGDTSTLQVGVDPHAPGRPHPELGPTDYSVHVELGTSRQAAQPYLRPALEQAGGRAI
jgi:HK97 gp10 family phage protein